MHRHAAAAPPDRAAADRAAVAPRRAASASGTAVPTRAVAQQARVMRLPPRLQRRVVRHVSRAPLRREAKLRAVPVRGAVRREDGERQVGEPPRDQLRVRLQHEMRGRVPAEVAGMAVLGHRQIAQQACASVRLGADREGEALARRTSGSSVSASTRSPALARQTSRYSRSNRSGSRAWIASDASDTSARETPKLPVTFRQRVAFLVVRAHRPAHVLRRDTGQDQRAGGLAPALPVGLARQHDPPHQPSKPYPGLLSNPGRRGMLPP